MAERKFVQRDIVIRNARLSFPALFSPKAGPAGADGKPSEPRYSAVLILDPDNPSLNVLVDAVKEVANDKWGENGAKVLSALKQQNALCFGKGSEKLNKDGDVPPELDGKYWVNVGRNIKKGPPLVVDKDPGVRLTEADGKVYAGCYVTAKVQVWPLDMPGVQRRIVATMDVIQFQRDGDAFGGGRGPSIDGLEDLSADEEGAALADDDIPF